MPGVEIHDRHQAWITLGWVSGKYDAGYLLDRPYSHAAHTYRTGHD